VESAKFSFHWWGANSTLSDRHQRDEPPAPHSVQHEALDVPEPRHAIVELRRFNTVGFIPH